MPRSCIGSESEVDFEIHALIWIRQWGYETLVVRWRRRLLGDLVRPIYTSRRWVLTARVQDELLSKLSSVSPLRPRSYRH